MAQNVWVKVFLSSVIAGYDGFRAAAADAIKTLGHQVLRAEDMPAAPGTPQQACLAAVRESDALVLLMGGQYGPEQATGLSATHEEYREARDREPVLVFVEANVDAEPRQEAFLDEVQAWATGHFRAGYTTSDGLSRAVIRALHDLELASAVGPVDEGEMLIRAQARLPSSRSGGLSARLALSVACGPYQQVVRPAQLDSPDLARDVQREALFGASPVLASSEGTSVTIRGSDLVLEQSRSMVAVDQAGSIVLVQPTGVDRQERMSSISALIEEDVEERLARGLRFTGWLLDLLDPVHRLTDVVAVTRLLGAGYMPWRTRKEHAADPNTAVMGSGGDESTVVLTPARRTRQALTHDADRMAEDLATLLRRDRTP
jgi:hypothetical protein